MAHDPTAESPDALLDSAWRQHSLHVAHVLRHIADRLYKLSLDTRHGNRTQGVPDELLLFALELWGLVGVKEDLRLLEEFRRNPEWGKVFADMKEMDDKLRAHSDGCAHRSQTVNPWNLAKGVK